jgi:cell wall-associated NlpC family hydrolase
MTIPEAVKKYMRVRYLPEGTDPSKGLDCWTFVKAFEAEFGIEVVDIADYVRKCPSNLKAQAVEAYRSQFYEVPTPQVLDLVLFDFEGRLHSGVYIGSGQFAHVGRAGFSVSRLGEIFWKSKILGYYRKVAS